MPTYVYEIVKPDGSPKPGSRFEVEQSIKAEPLKSHPQTGEPVRRVIQTVSILGGSAAGPASVMSAAGKPCGPSCGCHP